MPTLVVWGKKDGLIPSKFAKQFHNNIQHSKLVIMEDCGHTPYFEKPDRFHDVVVEFIKN